LVVLASLGLASLALADVPSDLTSTVSCYCDADPAGGSGAAVPGTNCTICPSGDGVPSFGTEDVFVNVVVRNVLGQPLAGSTVTVSSVAVAQDTVVWDDGLIPGGAGDPDEDPQTAVSAADGSASFMFDEGGIGFNEVAGTPIAQPDLDFLVTAQGPGPGGPVVLVGCVPQLNMISFDMRGSDCNVGLLDFGDFATCFGAGGIDTRCDFNWDTLVNLVDFGHFATHWAHDCDLQ
jgi:hypothetical protein